MIEVELVPARSLFKTPRFRDSPWIHGICDQIQQVADRPGHVLVTRDSMPPGHFGNYFGALTVRTYNGNDIFADLYHLHELVHTGTIRYDPSQSPLDWMRRTIASEFEASFISEAWVYVEFPDLRRADFPFPHEIWVDRFLGDASFMKMSREDKRETMRERRKKALSQPGYNDFIEYQMNNYFNQNMRWCGIWQKNVGHGLYRSFPAYAVVEQHMARLRTMSGAKALEIHRQWLGEVAHGTPFHEQALLFQQVYEESNREFGNWRLQPLAALPTY